ISCFSYQYHLFFVLFILFCTILYSSLFPYTTLFRSRAGTRSHTGRADVRRGVRADRGWAGHSHHADGAVHLHHRLRFPTAALRRSEEHTSELQSRENLVCRLLLEKKKKTIRTKRLIK